MVQSGYQKSKNFTPKSLSHTLVLVSLIVGEKAEKMAKKIKQ